MGINQIQNFSSPISPENLNATGRISRTSARVAVIKSHAVEDEVKITVRSQSNFIDLSRINEKINSVAESQKLYQKQLQQVDDTIERMKAQLGKILKQFPPYPPGSEDRVRALRACAGCRKLIDQLTLPPPDETLTQTLEELTSVSETPKA
jgi:hypothetical protein